jgi:hypothetical protein
MPVSGVLKRFFDSTIVDYEKWHDGVGYDLEALRELEGPDRKEALDWIGRRLRESNAGWRDAEAARASGDRGLIELARRHRDPEVRRLVATPEERRRDVLTLLRTGNDDLATLRALEDVPKVPDAEMRATLLWCTLHAPGTVAYHAAEALLQRYARVKDPWQERPFLLQFTEPRTRGKAYEELLRRIGGL